MPSVIQMMCITTTSTLSRECYLSESVLYAEVKIGDIHQWMSCKAQCSADLLHCLLKMPSVSW